MKIRLGTRGSDLALWQAHHVADRLGEEDGVEVEIVVLKTKGDRIDDVPLTGIEGKAFFTAEIERALLGRDVDLAVHSHKDLPTEGPPGLDVVAVPARGPALERLLAVPAAWDEQAALLPLRQGARVGTSSPRREQQLRALRPDLEVLPLRGNVPTRVGRLREGRFDAILLASAGLVRLELDLSGLRHEELAVDRLVPAPAQGALAIQVRSDDRVLTELCKRRLHDADTLDAIEAERSLLARAGGGCNLPLGVHVTRLDDGRRYRIGAFLGPDHPRAGLPARWARAEGASASAAADAVLALLMAGEATGVGPLAGRRLALVGSAEEGVLGARLVTLGARVRTECVLAFEDLDASSLDERLAELRRGDALAVTSRQAARRLAGHSVGAGVHVAAVGPATAAALEQAGLAADIVGTGGARSLARRLLDVLAEEGGARVLFPCAEGARSDLLDTLVACGVHVVPLATYRTVTSGDAAPQPGSPDEARIYTSPSAVRAALQLGLDAPGAGATRLAIGPTTAAALSESGLAALPCEGTGAESIVAALLGAAAPRTTITEVSP